MKLIVILLRVKGCLVCYIAIRMYKSATQAKPNSSMNADNINIFFQLKSFINRIMTSPSLPFRACLSGR